MSMSMNNSSLPQDRDFIPRPFTLPPGNGLKVCIAGGNGFIGSHLAKRLKANGYYVRVVGRKPNEFMAQSEFCDEFFRGDLRNSNTAIEACADCQHVYNLAADTGGMGFLQSCESSLVFNNTIISMNMLEAANRCLGPYLVEVSALVRDGVGLERLDKAIKNFGMPVGPITLADEVGVDVASHVAKFLSHADLGVRMTGGDVRLMEEMVKKGWYGKKSGQGFYTYKGKLKTISPEIQTYVNEFKVQSMNLTEKEIQDRIMTRFINEAVKCLEDEIIADPVVGDIGLVFGTGFAPFHGGPFCYVDRIGADKFVALMNGFADKYGPQFEPCQLLKDYAQANKKFRV